MKIFYAANTSSHATSAARANETIGDKYVEALDAFFQTFKLTKDSLAFGVVLV
jgi:hypothetical protein